VLALWGRGRITRQNHRKALCSFQALQTDKLDDRRPDEMAAWFGETPEPTVGLVSHSQVRQPAQKNTLVKVGKRSPAAVAWLAADPNRQHDTLVYECPGQTHFGGRDRV
jgi:hypothetical protein